MVPHASDPAAASARGRYNRIARSRTTRHHRPMTDPTPPLPIVHDLAQGRFEAPVDGGLAHVDYRRVGGTLHLTHTEVPPASAGRGIAAALVQAALDYAAGNGLKVMPLCSYARAYMRRHPDTHALLAPTARV